MPQWTETQLQTLFDLPMRYNGHILVDSEEANGVDLDGFFAPEDLQAILAVFSRQNEPGASTENVYGICPQCTQCFAVRAHCFMDGTITPIDIALACSSCATDLSNYPWQRLKDFQVSHPELFPKKGTLS
jgi:hypothetical protein